MAELLLRVVDKTHPDPILDASQTKAGDVIVVCDDNHPWGKQELTSPAWRILRVPGPKEDYIGLLAPEPGDRLTNQMLQRRLFKIDVSKMEAAESQAILSALPELDPEKAIAKRAQFLIPVKVKSIDDAKTQKDPKANPFVLGAEPLQFEVRG